MSASQAEGRRFKPGSPLQLLMILNLQYNNSQKITHQERKKVLIYENQKSKKTEYSQISNLILNSIHEVNSRNYQKGQLEIELQQHSTEKIKEEMKDNSFFILVDTDKITRVIQINLKEGKLDRLFLIPQCLGKGFGKKSILSGERYARKKGLKKLSLYPTTYALNFYKKAGYKIIKKCIGYGGYPVYKMEKSFDL